MIPFSFCQNPVRRLALVAGAFLLVLSGCDDTGTIAESTAPMAAPPDLTDARYRVSFDQTEYTFSTVWPDDLVAAVGSSKDASGDVEYLVDYEVTRETMSYDADGYLTSEYVFLDGHESTSMPEADYQAFADDMPYDAEHENPIVRVRLEGNAITYYRQDGTVDDRMQIDPEEYRLSPAQIDSLEASAADSMTVDARIDATRQRLDAQGVRYQMISGRLATTESTLDDLGVVTRATQVIDLAVGQPVQIVYLREDGRIDMQVDRLFQWADGVPYVAHGVTYQYGDVEGAWTVASRTETTRENVRVSFH